MNNLSTQSQAPYPLLRHRRKRLTPWLRNMVSEHRLGPTDLILPVFVHESPHDEPIGSMPGIMRLSIEGLLRTAKQASDLSIPAIAIFPVVPGERKSLNAEEALNPNNLVSQAVKALRDSNVEIGVITDVALDPYTTHGQDGLMRDDYVVNDETIDVLCRQAIMQAKAGSHIVAPSDMMDGRIGSIREALDSAGFENVLIMSYAAKYASAFYGPFRDAVGSQTNLGSGDKKTYQMDPANSSEAIREVASDVQEGADIVMVKPGLPYLDVIARVKNTFAMPTAAYHVSGEYAMVKAAAASGYLDGAAAMMESLISLKRAGADMILTYAALDAARHLQR